MVLRQEEQDKPSQPFWFITRSNYDAQSYWTKQVAEKVQNAWLKNIRRWNSHL
jgi:hypothetical protein